jgi:hypothetical protein
MTGGRSLAGVQTGTAVTLLRAAGEAAEAVDDNLEWITEAACCGHDPTLWDVDHERHKSQFRACAKCAQALRVCDRCPVRDPCALQAQRLTDVTTMRAGLAFVHFGAGKCDQVRPARQCAGCRLPVLGKPSARYCSTVCRQRAVSRPWPGGRTDRSA